ncbi:hypothetical protein Hanom_Chr13g01192121 [Helianthus anomalus]
MGGRCTQNRVCEKGNMNITTTQTKKILVKIHLFGLWFGVYPIVIGGLDKLQIMSFFFIFFCFYYLTANNNFS